LTALNALRPLTLVVAPVGYGRTTLLSAWLMLDESDSDPRNFLRVFLAAVQTPALMDGDGAAELLAILAQRGAAPHYIEKIRAAMLPAGAQSTPIVAVSRLFSPIARPQPGHPGGRLKSAFLSSPIYPPRFAAFHGLMFMFTSCIACASRYGL
jgi:hypothetical protein